jgi:hypothetical protein
MFRPYFWKGDGDDEDSDGMNDGKYEDPSSSVHHGAVNMEVDSTSPAGSGGNSVKVTAPGISQMAVTPFNHSPTTPRGKEIVTRARL